MAFTQKGLIVASAEMHAAIQAAAPNAYKVTSWQNDRSPKTQKSLCDLLRAPPFGHYSESVFDAPHGFRYLLFVYRTPEERRACWNVLTKETV